MRLTKKIVVMMLIAIFTFALAGCGNSEEESRNNGSSTEAVGELPVVTIEVDGFGTIKAELYPDKAPNTVNNFISLIESGYYDGLTFHRIIAGFMNQGGCPQGTGAGNPGYSIQGEFNNNGFSQNDLVHEAGVLSMARSSDPNSAGSQFFIMAEAAPHLDGDYAAFGKVIEGMDVVTAMNQVETDMYDAPVETVSIKSMTVDTKGVSYDNVEKVE